MNSSTSGSCECRPSVSLGAGLASIFASNLGRIFGYGDLFAFAAKGKQFCRDCVEANKLSLQVYHLRQDGVVERTGRGRFTYRVSDDTTTDFVYAGRQRKGATTEIDSPEVFHAAAILFDDGLHPQGVRFFTDSSQDELLQLAIKGAGDDIAIKEAYRLRDRLADDQCDLITDFRGVSFRIRVLLKPGEMPLAKME